MIFSSASSRAGKNRKSMSKAVNMMGDKSLADVALGKNCEKVNRAMPEPSATVVTKKAVPQFLNA